VLCCNGEPLVSNSSTVTGTVFVSETLARDLTPDFLTADNAAVVGWQRLPSAVAELVAGAWGLAHCTRLSLRRRPCLDRLLKPEVMSCCRTLLLWLPVRIGKRGGRVYLCTVAALVCIAGSPLCTLVCLRMYACVAVHVSARVSKSKCTLN
jgi:hypothetical protein